jgi:hypothetical protein
MAGGLPGLGIMVPTWLVGKFTIELDAFRTFGNSMFGDFPVMFDDTGGYFCITLLKTASRGFIYSVRPMEFS